MNPRIKIFLYRSSRQILALMLCALVLPLAQWNLFAQAPAFVPMDAEQLNQLVAPIALYPDSLIAQILTASTYPDQVNQANSWLQQNMGLPPDQRGDMANGMDWDPSVKALTAFPSVLDNLARNYSWTSQLGNAYYNQPGDVMNAVQAMRFQAQQAGQLASTPQQRVYMDNGEILIAPVNPGLVYVPYYNPWRIWGPTVVAYPGYYVMPPPPGVVIGLGIGFAAAAISIGLFAHYGWGWGAWAPNWHGGVVVYNRNVYYSRSVTVYNSGHFGGYNRGVYEHEGRGVPGGFHAPVTRANFAGRPEAARPMAGRPEPGGAGRPEARPMAGRPEPGGAGRPEARPMAPRPEAARPEAARPMAPRPEASRPAPVEPRANAPRPAPAAPRAESAAPYNRPPAAPQGNQGRPQGGNEQRPQGGSKQAPPSRGNERGGEKKEERGH